MCQRRLVLPPQCPPSSELADPPLAVSELSRGVAAQATIHAPRPRVPTPVEGVGIDDASQVTVGDGCRRHFEEPGEPLGEPSLP